MPSCFTCGDMMHPFDAETSQYCVPCAGKVQEEKPKKKRNTYIQLLQDTIEDREARITELENMIQNVAVYLGLPKFSQDTSVSKYDILNMLGRF